MLEQLIVNEFLYSEQVLRMEFFFLFITRVVYLIILILQYIQAAVADLKKSHEISPDDETIADAFR